MSNLATLLRNRGRNLSDLARALKVNKATVTRWNVKGVPHDRLTDVERETGIAACDLRPELARIFVSGQKEAAQ